MKEEKCFKWEVTLLIVSKKKEEEETKFVTKIEYEKNKEKALFNACVELQNELIGTSYKISYWYQIKKLYQLY